MLDDIRHLSDELARDPASLVFIALADALRRRGDLDLALKVVARGLARHAHDAAAYDVLARVHVDRGELESALEAWTMADQLAPGHNGARRGMGYALFRLGRVAEAEECLAAAVAGGDASAESALDRVRAARSGADAATAAMLATALETESAEPVEIVSEHEISAFDPSVDSASGAMDVALYSMSDALELAEAFASDESDAAIVSSTDEHLAAERSEAEIVAAHADAALDVAVIGRHADATKPASEMTPPFARVGKTKAAAATHFFADALADGPHTALLLDTSGLVIAGAYITEDGTDVAPEISARLSGVRDEADRMITHLELVAWHTVVVETDVATITMAPVGDDDLLVVASDRSMPLGLVRRVASRCAERARSWLAEVA